MLRESTIASKAYEDVFVVKYPQGNRASLYAPHAQHYAFSDLPQTPTMNMHDWYRQIKKDELVPQRCPQTYARIKIIVVQPA